MSDASPRLALTVGDPAGIGPEIALKALASPERPAARWVVYGPASALDQHARLLGLSPLPALGVEAVDTGGACFELGRVSPESGRSAADAVVRAAREALAGRLAGIVTGPLHKESLRAAGHPWPGHTELLADTAGTRDVAMMFVGGGLRVALLTIHRPLRSVPDAITGELVKRVVHLVDRELPRFGAARRRIAVCGVNPHAGEAGLFGREEVEVIAPAVEALRGEGIDVHGPRPADTLFPRAALGEWDAVIAAYHDQGLVPVKLAAFGRSVNVTLGLPFVRTSVDHGTAFDIVGKGTADPGSLIEAMRLAVTLAATPPGATVTRFEESSPVTRRQPSSRSCFVCGRENPVGLRVRWDQDEEAGEIRGRVTIDDVFNGYPGVAHGGIVAAVLDETAGRTVLMKGGFEELMVTAKLDVAYRRPTPTGVVLDAVGRLVRHTGTRAEAEAELRLPDGTVTARATVVLARPPASITERWQQERVHWRVD